MRLISHLPFAFTFAVAVAACGEVENPQMLDATVGDVDAPVTDIDAPASPGGDVPLRITEEPPPGSREGYLVAYRDGDGAWTAAPAGAGGNYTVPARSGRYQIAIACQRDAAVDVRVFGFTYTEQPMLQLPSRCAPRTTVLSGSVDFLLWPLRLNTGDAEVLIEDGSGFSVRTAPGIRDLLLGSYDSPAVNAPANGIGVALGVDLRGPSANLEISITGLQPVAQQAVTVGLLTGETAGVDGMVTSATTRLRTSRDDTAPFAVTILPEPAAHGVANQVQARVYSLDRFAVRQRWVDGATPVNFAVLPTTPLPSISRLAASPYPRFGATWTSPPPADVMLLDVEQMGCDSTCFRLWSVLASPAFLQAGGVLDVPDLIALPGWLPVFSLETGETTVSASTYTATGGITAYVLDQHVLGDEATRVGRYQTNPP